MEISRIIWVEDIVDKLLWKHNVKESEVIEVFENKPKFQYTKDKQAIIVSARDMTKKERKKYVK